jgi:hypothetical protein
VGHPGNLQGMQVFRSTDSFNGFDKIIIADGLNLLGAGPHHFAADNNRTSPALAVPASDFTAREEELFAQHLRQSGLAVNYQSARLSVYCERLFIHK